jgi:predicted enzyme related to lactoylglutathione lyase
VISGAHAIVFTSDPEGMRAFFRDVIELPWVDAGGGWLIFALAPAELAAHPAEQGEERFELYLMCDDLPTTVEHLEKKGVGLTRPITEEVWGLVTAIELPDGRELALYEPRHPIPHGPVGDDCGPRR